METQLGDVVMVWTPVLRTRMLFAIKLFLSLVFPSTFLFLLLCLFVLNMCLILYYFLCLPYIPVRGVRQFRNKRKLKGSVKENFSCNL